MRLMLVRHAEAMEADSFPGADIDRPLTAAGRRLARLSLARLSQLIAPPDVIFSSEATRCRETAKILSLCMGGVKMEVNPRLNPGASAKDFRSVWAKRSKESVAVVGHEPDLSLWISRLVAGGTLAVKLRKGAVVLIELDARGRGTLRALVPPEWLVP